MEEKLTVRKPASAKTRTRTGASLLPLKTLPPCPRTHLPCRKRTLPPIPNPGTQVKSDHSVEGTKTQSPPLQGPRDPPEETETALLRGADLITEVPLKAAGPVAAAEGSFTAEAVVTEGPSRPALGLLGRAGAGSEAAPVETTAHLWDTTRTPKGTGQGGDMARIGPSIIPQEPGTGVRPAARGQSMKRSPKEDGKGARRRAARVAPVTWGPRTKRTTQKQPRTGQKAPAPPSPLLHPEATRPGCLLPEEFPPDGAGVVAAVALTSSAAVATWGVQLGGTGLGPPQLHTVGPQSQFPPENSKHTPKCQAPKTRAEG